MTEERIEKINTCRTAGAKGECDRVETADRSEVRKKKRKDSNSTDWRAHYKFTL